MLSRASRETVAGRQRRRRAQVQPFTLLRGWTPLSGATGGPYKPKPWDRKCCTTFTWFERHRINSTQVVSAHF